MKEYTKIDTIFARDMEGTKRLMPGVFRSKTVEYLAGADWVWTEKIDGTNIRVYWDGHRVEFGGRTEKAQIPAKLVAFLNEKFGGALNEEVFEQKFGENEVILFGEGYGAGIQKGGSYRSDVSFILFDVCVGNVFLERENVEDIAKTFGLDVVPIVGRGTLSEAVEFIKSHPASTIGTAMMEGVVARPAVELKDRLGRRVIVKIKWEDFRFLV